MTIKIIGVNTEMGNKLKNNIIEIVDNLDEKIKIELENKNGAVELPLLYINDLLVCKGKVPNINRLKKYIKRSLSML